MQSEEKSTDVPETELASSTRESLSPDPPEGKKTFKSQSLNSLFRRSSPERPTVSPTPASPHGLGKASPVGEKLTLAKTSPGITNATLAKTKGLSSSTGVFKLAAMKRDNSMSRNGGPSGSPSASHSPSQENPSVWKVPSSEPKEQPENSKPESSNTEPVRERKKSTTEMTEEELAELGIFLTHRLEKTDEKNSRSFNWDDDDDTMDDAELAKLEGLSSLKDGSRSVTPSSSKGTTENSGPKLAPWHSSVPDQKSYVSIADQMKELAEKKHTQQQKQNTIKTNYKQNQIHGFHGARGGHFEENFGGKWGSSFDDDHFSHSRGFHDMHNSAYKYTEHDKRYREFERPHPELYNTRSRQFELVGPPRDREGFPGRRYSREGPPFRDLSPRYGRPESPPRRRRPSEDEDWRRGSHFAPSEEQPRGSFSKRRPSIASSENSHGKSAISASPELSKAQIKPSPEEQKEKMRQRLEAARKRKEEEQREEKERLEAAQRKADALAKEVEEKHKKEQEEALQEQKRREEHKRKQKEEEEAKRKSKYIVPSKKVNDNIDQRERAKSTTSNASIDDNTVRAVDKLVKTDDKEERLLSRSKVMNSDSKRNDVHQKDWGEIKNSRDASPSRLWGANHKSNSFIWSAKDQKENTTDDDAPWDGDWRTARAEYKKEHPINGESRFFPKTNNPRIVLPPSVSSETVSDSSKTPLPVPISPIVQSNNNSEGRQVMEKGKNREKKVNLPVRKIEIPINDIPTVKVQSDSIGLSKEFTEKQQTRVKLAVSMEKPKSNNRIIPNMAIPPITWFTSTYYEDSTGYMHRREYEQGKGPNPDYVVIRLPSSKGHDKVIINGGESNSKKYPRAKVVFIK